METYILLLVIVISAYTDLKSRKILNKITFPAILLGLLYHGLISGLNGLWFSLIGLIVGLAILLIPFVLGGMGAGDVKLMGAIGALMGAKFAFHSFLYAAIFGGLIALYIIVRRKELSNFFKRMVLIPILFKETKGSLNMINKTELAPSFPYGVAIALGAVCTLLFGGIV